MAEGILPKYTRKQMGDACEMLVAAELTLAGIPALKVPDNWPHYDVIAQPLNMGAQRVSVKSRTFKKGAAFLSYNCNDEFDWLAMVLLHTESERSIYIIPRKIADKFARQNAPHTKSADSLYFKISDIPNMFEKYKNNFDFTIH